MLEQRTQKPSSPVSRWYLVHCKPGQDWRALENLERQGFNCYLPTLSVERIRNGRKTEIKEPLFPRYLFIKLDEVNDNWAPIRSTYGVATIVRFSDHPLPIDDRVIELIRKRLSSTRKSRARRILKPGDRVRVTDGTFKDVEAIFVANDSDERVILLMSLLHRELRFSVPIRDVQKKAGND